MYPAQELPCYINHENPNNNKSAHKPSREFEFPWMGLCPPLRVEAVNIASPVGVLALPGEDFG